MPPRYSIASESYGVSLQLHHLFRKPIIRTTSSILYQVPRVEENKKVSGPTTAVYRGRKLPCMFVRTLFSLFQDCSNALGIYWICLCRVVRTTSISVGALP